MINNVLIHFPDLVWVFFFQWIGTTCMEIEEGSKTRLMLHVLFDQSDPE